MDSCKQLIINHLIGGGQFVKLFDYSRLADLLCLHQGGQSDTARERLAELRDSGRYNVAGYDNPLLSSEVAKILQGLREDIVNQLRSNIEALEYIDTLTLANESKPTIVSASIEDIIKTALDSGCMKKPSDWAAVVMLATDLGKPITSTSLCNALSNNADAIKFGLPIRQSLNQAYIEHTKKHSYPNWGRKSQKEERYFKIAESIYGLMQVFEK